ncbi:CHAP domain-containing protein [Actinomadura sp. DC4]|uniref:CHAP domain-containing protein n=1 Tax=Actinomadura sp. DC4 TaxID=3055069 RepID=UPI0025B08966|nr:CHAP domain-containing protein [Actinomadura sp. DC4]MDN3355158.1 CHAP domain-containing protein [Actinomadura sp. DC4]
MSGRHTKTCRVLHSAKLGGALAGVAVAGATAVSLIAAGPASSSQKVNAISAGALAAAPRAAAVQKEAAHPLAAIPLPGKGIADANKNSRTWLPTASDALKLAEAQVGVTEDSAGGGTKFQKWFVSSPWAERGVQRDGGSVSDYANANWCDMFVSWVGAQLGVKGMGADAFTRTHAEWFKDQGRWGDTPKPGAVVFYSWSGSKSIGDIDHVGMVIKDNHNGTIQTIEGNTDNAVKVRTRDVSSVVGYGYPEYGPDTA